MLKKRKAQVAIEFLMTYGWAMLIVSVVLAALFFLGVFDPGFTNNCKAQAPFLCNDVVFREEGLELWFLVKNILNGDITGISVNEEDCNNIKVNGIRNGLAGSEIKDGSNKVICYGLNIKEKDKVNGEVNINYKSNSGLQHINKFLVSGKVETSNYVNNFDDNALMSFNFDEDNSTTAIDNSYYNHNGVLNGVTLTLNCISGGCYSFDGVNDWINISASSFKDDHPKGAFTIEAWINTFGKGGTQYQSIVDTIKSGSNGFQLRLGESNTKVKFVIANTTKDQTVTGNANLNNNTWYHLIFTWDGTTNANGLKLYINGILDKQATSTVSGEINSSRDLGIGTELSLGATFFNGSIDNVRIYNKALTATEVKKHYDNTKIA